MKNNISLSNSHLDGSELRYVKEALEKNELTYGDNLNVFEKDLEDYLGKQKNGL